MGYSLCIIADLKMVSFFYYLVFFFLNGLISPIFSLLGGGFLYKRTLNVL